jgi:hypothetical protein
MATVQGVQWQWAHRMAVGPGHVFGVQRHWV